jgi:hypothetical protein
MSHKAKLAALVLGALMSSQALAVGNSVYLLLGGGYGLVKDGKIDSITPDLSGNAAIQADDDWQWVYHGGLGVMVDSPWGLETNYWQYQPIKRSASQGVAQVHQNNVSRSVDLTVVGRACLMQPLTGYVRLGIGYAWLNRDNSLTNVITTSGDDRNVDGVGVAAAVGLEWDFNDWMFTRLEAATITGDAMQSNGTLNIGFRFA